MSWKNINIPDNITLEKQFTHHALINTIDLANLRQLQRTRCTGKQETDDYENWIVQDGNGYVFSGESEHRCHDESWKKHAGDEGCYQELGADFVLFGVFVEGLLGEGIACQVGAEDNKNQGDCDAAGLRDGSGDGVGEEGSIFKEETLEFGNGSYNDGE